MEIHVLASGSTGNSIFLKLGNAKILIDAGISARRTKKALAAVGTAIEDIDAVFITHEHRDHVTGLATLTKKYRLPVYTRPGTWQNMYCREILPAECCFELQDSMDVGDVKVEPFGISHDAADPVGFNFFHRQVKCSVVTDLGFVTDSVKKAMARADVMVFEANHDVDLLRTGSYPWPLKRRIMSNRGHLSNMDTGWTLARLDRKNSVDVFLAHLSQENNRPELAETTVKTILEDQGCHIGTDVSLHLTYPDRTASLAKVF